MLFMASASIIGLFALRDCPKMCPPLLGGRTAASYLEPVRVSNVPTEEWVWSYGRAGTGLWTRVNRNRNKVKSLLCGRRVAFHGRRTHLHRLNSQATSALSRSSALPRWAK